MLSESKEETLNSVQDFPLHFPPAEGGKLESFNLAGCSPRKVVLVEEKKYVTSQLPDLHVSYFGMSLSLD